MMTIGQDRTRVTGMRTATHDEQVAAVLRLTRANIGLSQPERVAELLAGREPDEIIQDNLDVLYAEQDNSLSEVRHWNSLGFNTCTIRDPEYPTLLREVHQAPAVLFWQGELNTEEVGISIVGSRKATDSQLGAAYQLAEKLAKERIPVISGLAAGIDTAAHRGALDSGGRTISVMGTGLATTYPKANFELRQSIQNSGGLVLTQFEPEKKPARWSFPMRNEVMSGYGAATVVMAAGEQSGTKHQVKAAIRHGRDVVFTARIGDEVSWARELISKGKAHTASSLDEAVELVNRSIERRQSALQLLS